MKKLIDLLNEYDDNNWGVTDYGALFNRMNEGISETEYLQVISKKFGFIKWLIQKDKINFDKVMKLGIPCFVQYDNGEIISVHDVDFDRQLIMLLSISDSPIEDLISILK